VKKDLTYSLLHTIALVLILTGTAGSLWFMFYAGRNNPSFFLMALFVIWVSSPFVALRVAHIISKRWTTPVRLTTYCLIFVLTIGSLVTYSGALSPPGTKPAFVFLVIPLISWLLILSIIPIAVLRSRRLSGRSQD